MRTKALPKPKAPKALPEGAREIETARLRALGPGEVAAIFADCEARLQWSRDSGTYERTNPPWMAKR